MHKSCYNKLLKPLLILAELKLIRHTSVTAGGFLVQTNQQTCTKTLLDLPRTEKNERKKALTAAIKPCIVSGTT